MTKSVAAVFVSVLALLAFSPTIFGQVSGYERLATSAEAYVSGAAPTANFADSGQLHFSVAYLPDESVQLPNSTIHCPTVTQQIVLRFDVADVPFAIDGARLTLRPKSPTTLTQAPTLSAALQPWDAATVTWETRPAAHAQLGVSATASGPSLIWQDDQSDSANTLAEWLEYRRQSADSVTLLLDLPANSPCWPYKPANGGGDMVFFDSLSDLGAVLELNSAETDLPTLNPSAVSLADFGTTNSSRTLLLVALLVAFGTLYIGFMDD